MADNRLILGTRRYSSWSMRGWLAVRLAGLEVEEDVIPLAGDGPSAVRGATPSGLVPALHHDGAVIWESLAIGEYCAELAPGLWPGERVARGWARAIAAEMHAGFRPLRVAMPMVLGRETGPRETGPRETGPRETGPEVAADIARVEAIWGETRRRFGGGGGFLFGGSMGLADVMFAPVVARFLTYRPALSEASSAYCAVVRGHPLVDRWYQAAAAEPVAWRLDKYERA